MDSSSIDPSKSYVLSGSSLISLYQRIERVEAGENIHTSGSGLKKQSAGAGGVNLSLLKPLRPSVLGSKTSPLLPLHGVDASVGSTPRVKIIIGTVGGIVPTIGGSLLLVSLDDAPALTVGTGDTLVYVEVDVPADPTAAVIVTAQSGGAQPADVLNDDGSATLYQTLFFIRPVVASSVASVGVSANLSGSIVYLICGGTSVIWEAI